MCSNIVNDMADSRITTQHGTPANRLGLAAQPHQGPSCVGMAVEAGINYFFFYGPSQKDFAAALTPLIRERAHEIIVASGSGARTQRGLQAARRNILSLLGTELIDVFFAEYIHPGVDPELVFGSGGVLDELQRWKANGWIRYAGASAHDRRLALALAQDSRVDVLMHRYNMAHRKAEVEVFPAAIESGTPIVAFTATRWRTLLKSHAAWSGDPPTAVDCYRFCLAEQAVQLVLSAPNSVAELNDNLAVLTLPPMDKETCHQWARFGDILYSQGRSERDEFESRWP